MTVNIPAWLLPALANIAVLLALAVYTIRKARAAVAVSFWMVGEFKGVTKRGNIVWTFKGLYSDRAKALSECKGKSFFLVPVALDTTVTEETSPKVEYPNLNEAKNHGA